MWRAPVQAAARCGRDDLSPLRDHGTWLQFDLDSRKSNLENLLEEQVAALFKNVAVGVGAAGLAAPALAMTMTFIGHVEATSATIWSAFIIGCALVHLALFYAYTRHRRAYDVRRWALLFTGVALAEGLGWGWAPAVLAAGQPFEVEIFSIAVISGISGGAIAAFGSYMPAFLAFLLPATLPFSLFNIASHEPLRQVAAAMLLFLLGSIWWLGLKANRSFAELVGLRLATEEMAHALRRQKEIAEQANAAKSAFLAAASHDLRQPIHALSLFIGALRGMRMPREGRAIIEKIEESTAAMDGLFGALLDISKLDAGTVEVHPRPFDIGSLVDRVCSDHAREAELKGLSLRHVRSHALVFSDPMLVERILRNLISNAIRYTTNGGIVIGCRRRGASLAIQISDTGAGIPKQEQAHIFEEYYQLANPERDRAKGLGLGLAIVRRLSNLLEAPLALRSTPGKGSTFELLLPGFVGKLPQEEVVQDPRGALTRAFIVVIDDEQAIREAMGLLLTNWGHDVLTAESGEEAVTGLSSYTRKPDLIISDYRLRHSENGIAAIELLRSEFNETIPAMLITGDTAPDRLIEAQRSGLVLLHKPIPNGKLRAAINNIIIRATRDHVASDDVLQQTEFSAD